MIDWSTIGRVWVGYGVNIIVLLILALIAWAVGLLVQRMIRTKEGGKNTKQG